MGVVKVKFYNFIKTPNSTKRVAEDMESVELNCKFKQATSIVDPVLIVNSSDIYRYNYCYIEEFGRYYFVSNHTSYPNNIWEVSCSVDVMATYKTEILSTEAYVISCADSGYYDLDVQDTRVIATNRSGKIETGNISEKIPRGFETGNAGTYVLGVVGQNNFVNYYLCEWYQLGRLAEKLLTDQNFIEEIKQWWQDPFDALVSLHWLPMKPTEWSGANTTIKVGSYDSGVEARAGTSNTCFTEVFELSIPKLYNDFRNAEPYSRYDFRFPSCGTIPINTNDLYSAKSLRISYTVDYRSGDIAGHVSPWGDNTGRILFEFSGNCMCPLQLSTNNTNIVRNVLTTVSGVTSALVAGYAGSVPGVIFSLAALGGSIQGRSVNSNGYSGGVAGITDSNYARIVLHTKETTTSPTEIAEVTGLPCGKVVKLSNLRGYVKCANAFIKCSATNLEHELLQSMVNSGLNTIWGGIIIE